jgi:hypothetical protein
MRHLLPAVLCAALFAPTAAGAAANHVHRHRDPRVPGSISLHLSSHDLLTGRRLDLRGRVRPGGRHRVKIVLRGPWRAPAWTRTDAAGRFRLGLRVDSTGAGRVRAYAVHDRRMTGSASVARRLTVYRPAAASYYGPGLYGGALACGGTLEPDTLGVANMSLPCGTRVRLRYRGRSLTVPVIDRGPYVGGRVYDLTEATKRRLGFPDLGVVLSSR